MQLTGARSLALRQELTLAFRGKAFQQKMSALIRQQADPQAFYRSFQSLVQNVQADVLNRCCFEATGTGMAEIAAEALVVCLEGPHAAPVLALIWRAKVADAIDMLQELLTCFSSPKFQMELNKLHRSRQPCSAGFGDRFADLLAPVYAQVLPKYGFTGDEKGIKDMTLAMGRVMNDMEVRALATSIDSVLYGAMAPGARHPAPEAGREGLLEKPQVMRLLREQLAAFSDPNFQHEVGALRRLPRTDGPGVAAERARLALTEQRRIFQSFGLEGSPRGAHVALHLCARHIWDPEVARLAWGIHFLLGMDEPGAVVERLRCIQAEIQPASGS